MLASYQRINNILETPGELPNIVVFKEGGILATGTHAELLETCLFYHELHHRQFA